MGGERGRIVGVGASLALLVALPLLITHVAGAARSQVTSAAAALLVVDADGATAMLPDGTARAAVPWLQPGDGDLAVSPSGRKLAFTRERSGNRELYVADLATGELDRLTSSPRREDVEPTWSPDGAQLAWASGTESNHDLYRIRLDSGRVRPVTSGPEDDREPTWSPDGRRVAFASNAQGSFDLWAVAARGGEPELVLDAVGEARSPDWHPTAARLAYTGIVGGAADVWVAGFDGSTKRVTVWSGYDGRPDWSPDGRRLAFLRGRGGTLQPWLARLGGGAAVQLVRLPRGARELDWARLRGELAPRRTALLPDLDQRPPSDLAVSSSGGRHRLGFTSATDNLGTGPVWLRGRRRTTAQAMLVEQLVAHEGGSVSTLRRVGVLRYERHPPHRHWHLDDFVRYELRTVDGRALVRDRKTGFCLIDRWGFARALAGRPRVAPRFVGDCAALQPDALRVEEGSSVGYTDRYPAFFHGQDLDLTGVRGGIYVLVQHANPERRLRELDYANNAASALVRVSWPSGRARPPRVDVLRTCGASARCDPLAAT